MLIFLSIITIVGLVLLFAAFQKQSSTLRQIAQGLLVSYVTILILLLMGEGYFRYFHAESTSFLSLSHLNWLARYQQLNSLGYRDHEWQAIDFEERTVVVAIGDSFTAGHGINDPQDRWTNVLANSLGDEYAVVNLGISGSATRQQLEALQNFDLATPDIVIWQYFLNDIEFAAAQNGSLPPITPPPAIVQESYLLNFLYFRVAPIKVDYFGWLYSNYDNYAVWQLHQQEIEAVGEYVDRIGAELIVLIYPDMVDPVGSIPYVDRVAQAIEASGHTQFIKFFDAAAAWDSDTPLVVSNFDVHPSVEFNAYAAEQIYELYFQTSP